MHSKVRNIPRNTQLRGRLFDKWPRKGLSGACCGPSGRFPGPQPGEGQRVQRRGTGTGRGFCGGAGAGPARSAARDRAVQVVLRWSPEAEPACSAAQDGGSAGGSAVEPGRGQRVQRWDPVRDGGGTGGGSAAQAGAGPACSTARDRGGTGSSEVQTGRAGPGSQKKCSEGKMRPPPGRKKSVPRGRCAAARTHTGTKKTDLGPFTSIFATLLCYSTGFCSGMLVRYTLPHDNGSALREPVSFAGDFRQHVLLQQPVCLRFRSARRSGSQP